jgi:hypothetical protein
LKAVCRAVYLLPSVRERNARSVRPRAELPRTVSRPATHHTALAQPRPLVAATGATFADERMSSAVTSLRPGQAPFRLDRRDGLAECSGDHAPNLPPFSCFHEIRIAPFRPDHGVGECVDGLGRVRDHPLLFIRPQAIAEANAQIVEQFDDIHQLMVARLGRLGPVVRYAASRAGIVSS